MLKYDLSEMKSADGSALRYEVEARASELAIRISHELESMPMYKRLAEKLPDCRILLYMQFMAKKEIYPYVRQACIIEWYKRNSIPLPAQKCVVKIPICGILPLLRDCWDFKDAPVKMINMISADPISIDLLRRIVKSNLKKFIAFIENDLMGRSKINKVFPARPDAPNTLACHYVEGFDPLRRNDLNWHAGSGIDPKRVLIYFDSPNSMDGKIIKEETFRQLKDSGFRIIALKGIKMKGGACAYWSGPVMRKSIPLHKSSAKNSAEKWICEMGNDLLEAVEYWRSFYKAFNIRINYISEEGMKENFAQAVAFDVDDGTSGLVTGKQRSEVFFPYRHIIGYHPKHIFFMWSKRAASYIGPKSEQIERLVLTGYPNSISNAGNADYPGVLRSRGAKFIIALFDNVHGNDCPFSTRGMTIFYQAFLQWVLEDKSVGLILKSKKPHVINNLPEIQPLLARALESGRCIRLGDEFGRLPSDASIGADMAVGPGIASAVVEAVIGGCRGVLYDMTHLKSHEFYRWGYERIIFDDLSRLMNAVKRYKDDTSCEPGLGDWSEHIAELDPFRDGKGGERMGIYMRWLLESFDAGKGRDGAMEEADRLYSDKWGKDKIIKMERANG